MGYRRLMIESPVEISTKNEQLIVQKETAFTFPIEDIDAILFECPQVKISASTIAKLAEAGCAVFFCDSKHLPCCVLMPFMQHSRQLSVLKLQLSQTEPQKKRIWQQIVIRKIVNQSRCLDISGFSDAASTMRSMSNSVTSGDSGNVEATAAAFYFPKLFDSAFIRSDSEDGRNAALNYGYAILRGTIARTLAVYGFMPSIGIHHRSELNAFNLADDLIESYRPLVDCYVFQNIQAEHQLTAVQKHALFNLLNNQVTVNKRQYSASYAIEMTVQSLLRKMRNAEDELQLPYLSGLKQQPYE